MNVPLRTLSLVLTVIFAFSICENSSAQNKIFTVVIDPGHGGNHPGAVNGTLLEKDLNLSIAQKLGNLIVAGVPDVKVIYTRTGDSNPSLAARGALANKANADLFISIHTNAHKTASANGTSTYIMGMSKSDENLAEAMRENEVIKYEADYTATYDGFDPSSAESYIMFNLMQYAHFDRSLQLAKTVQKHYAKNTPMRDRGAAQGPYLVLWKTTMPSVLTEIGFISNDSDRRYISSSKGQDAIARSLYEAFREYKAAVAAQTAPAGGNVAVAVPTTPSAVPAATPPQEGNSSRAGSPAATPPQEGNSPRSGAPAATPPIIPSASPAQEENNSQFSILNSQFYVQLSASSMQIPTNDDFWDIYRGKVVVRAIDGWFKYFLGPYATEAEAIRERDRARKTKFKDAFITK